MASKIYTDVARPSGPAPDKKPKFGKKGKVDRSDAGRDETESIPSLGAKSKEPFKAPAPSDVGRLKGKK